MYTCPECGHDLADDAITCPHCGHTTRLHPLNFGKAETKGDWAFTIILCLLVVAAMIIAPLIFMK